jgi:DNA-binding HxlR family transcriptional regulator
MKCFIDRSLGQHGENLARYRNLAFRSDTASMDHGLPGARSYLAGTSNASAGDHAMATANSAPACGCPVEAFQKMISGKYKLRIVWDLKDGPRRYGEIRTGLLRGAIGSAEIAPRVLSRELKALAESGLIDRRDYGTGSSQGGISPDPQGQELRSRDRRHPRLGRAPSRASTRS